MFYCSTLCAVMQLRSAFAYIYIFFFLCLFFAPLCRFYIHIYLYGVHLSNFCGTGIVISLSFIFCTFVPYYISLYITECSLMLFLVA